MNFRYPRVSSLRRRCRRHRHRHPRHCQRSGETIGTARKINGRSSARSIYFTSECVFNGGEEEKRYILVRVPLGLWSVHARNEKHVPMEKKELEGKNV